MSNPPPHPPPPPPPVRWNYDVFLSFRSMDTRHGFTRRLYRALSEHGIYTFMDDLRTRKGQDVGKELNDKIDQSKGSIVVFSENYASSRWCLDELVTIIECNKKRSQLGAENNVSVWPILYKVDLSEALHRAKVYMAEHEKRFESEKVRLWRRALDDLADMAESSWHFKSGMLEAQVILEIVKEVSEKLDCRRLNVAHYPIGLDHHVHNINPTVLGIGSDDDHVLFCWYAFKKPDPPEEFEELVKNRILQFVSGIPLAIAVMGSHLYGRGVEEWKKAIARLEQDEQLVVDATMRISYEGLDASEKVTFLLISCFLNGKERDEIVEVLSRSGTELGGCIDVLVSKCLVGVDRTKLWVHDLAREMARQILCTMSLIISATDELEYSDIESIARSIFREIMRDSDYEDSNGLV